MNRQQFNSRNDIGKILTFQKSGSTNSFDPTITFVSGSRRVSWRLNNGSEIKQIAGNNIVYTGFTSDTNIRTIEMRGNNFKNINTFNLNNDNLYGNLDVSGLPDLGYTFQVYSNDNLTGITHSTSTTNMTIYQAYSCDLTGNLDLTPLNLGGDFRVYDNPKLTGITHSSSSIIFGAYQANNCNLRGNLNLSMLSKLGGNFALQSNPNLTGITHTYSPTIFTNYNVSSCNITGLHNLTMFPNLGGSLQFNNNSNLTGITHTASTENITFYLAQNSNLTGNHNLSWFPNLGGVVAITNNSNLTSITHTASTKNFIQYNLHQCDLTGTHDLSMFSNFGGDSTGSTCYVTLYINPNLTDITFPTTNGYFKNFVNTESQGALGLYSCNLNYVNFKPLSGVTFLTGTTQGNPRISLRDNGMSATDVNHILVDFSGNTTTNPTGWSNINLNIGGSNANPDSSSGGYDGLAAISFLTGSPYNWTITY